MPIEPPLVPIGPSDLGALTALVAEAGWNQTEADWLAMLASGEGLGVRDEAGRVIASGLLMPYGTVGWIGMVLVHGPFRRRGIATRLLAALIARARTAGLVPALDATPAGRPVYEALGFSPVDSIERWRGPGGAGAPARAPLSPDRIRMAEALDAQAFGSSRPGFLTKLLDRPGAFALAAEPGDGVLFVRPGRTATQVGPMLSSGDDIGLLDRALDAISGPVLLDVPVRQAAIADHLRARGFVVERPFTRMALGAATATSPAMRIVAGPELG